MAHSSKKAVVTAIVANSTVTIIKYLAALVSGSTSMMNEAVHSLMDSLNQGFLFLGLREAERPADQNYAFGHGQKKYLWNLWSAIGLFSIGAGLGLSHAWHSWQQIGEHAAETASAVEILGISFAPLSINLIVLFIALILEGYSFLVALKAYYIEMRRDGYSNPFSYLLRSDNPTLVAIVLEDSVAMLGLLFAALGIGLTAITGQQLWDILFSALIAVMLGFTAFYLGWLNMRFLADMRDLVAEKAFLEVALGHGEVECCHDLRSIVLDENHTILVAEVELREETIVPGLYEQIEQEKNAILDKVPSGRRSEKEVQCYAAVRASVTATISRTEQIIDELEAAVKKIVPRVSHITLEVEGNSEPATILEEIEKI
jgi:cation diffusion facilitator family transporter